MPTMPDDKQLYRLLPDVEVVRRSNTLMLVSSGSGAAVRISPAAEALLPLLEAGTSVDELQTALQEKHPQARDINSKLTVFLQPLVRSGLLTVGNQSKRKRKGWPKLELFQPDPLAAVCAALLLKPPALVRRTLLAVLLLGSLAGIVQLILMHRFPSPHQIFDAVGIPGFFIFFLVVVPIHEAAHAIACRMAGIEVGAAGIILHGNLMPGPYIETTKAYRVQNRIARFWIPAAGPIINLLGTGIAAWLLIWLDPHRVEAVEITQTVFFLCAVFVYLDTNPFGPSDGSHMVEALLEDELARRNAWSFRKLRDFDQYTAVRYRWACVIHMLLAIVAMYFWIR